MRIIAAGLRSTVQDRGRFRHQHEGIPVAGAMDELALRVGNLLVGNDENAAVLECTLVGPTLRFDEHMLIALTGGCDPVRWSCDPVGAPSVIRAGAADPVALSLTGRGPEPGTVRGFSVFGSDGRSQHLLWPCHGLR